MTAGWEPPERLDTRLRVMTWNVWWRFGPWVPRQRAILDTLADADADVICLQEVWGEPDGEGQPALLADALGYHHAHAVGIGADVATHSLGNAVLSRWPITNVEIRSLPAPEGLDEMRTVVRAEVGGPRGPVEVFCTHLNWRLDQSHVRRMQAAAVCEFIAESAPRRTYPPVLCGDLNAEPDSDELRALTGLAAPLVSGLVFLDAWRSAGDGGPGYTWSRANPFTVLDPEPDRRIDYVLVGYPGDRAAGEPVSCRLAGTEPVDGVTASDHHAVVADLRY